MMACGVSKAQGRSLVPSECVEVMEKEAVASSGGEESSLKALYSRKADWIQVLNMFLVSVSGAEEGRHPKLKEWLMQSKVVGNAR